MTYEVRAMTADEFARMAAEVPREVVRRPDKTGAFPPLALPFAGSIALGNGTQWHFIIAAFDEYVFVAVLGWGWGVLPVRDPVSSQAVIAALHDSNPPMHHRIAAGDAGNVADLLNDQVGHRGVARQGHYYPDLVCEWSQA